MNVVTDFVAQRENEEKTVVMSRVSAPQFKRVMEIIKSKCTLDNPTWGPDEETKRTIAALDASMPDFQWASSKEDSPENKTRYMNYLMNNISLPNESKLFDGSGTSDLLEANMTSIGVKTKGNIDVVMAHNRFQSVDIAVLHMWAGIELKKQDNKEGKRIRHQVILQHLSSSYLNQDKPRLTIMTDLGERWHFLWFSKSKRALMIYEATSKGEANYFIRHMMEDTDSTAVPTDFLNRSSWNEMFSLETIPEEKEGGIDNGRDGNDNEKGGGDDYYRGGDEDHGTRKSFHQAKKHRQNANLRGQGSKGSSGAGATAHTASHSLDFMDEEEEQEAIFRAVVGCLLPQLEFSPQVAEIDRQAEGPPTHIGVQ